MADDDVMHLCEVIAFTQNKIKEKSENALAQNETRC